MQLTAHGLTTYAITLDGPELGPRRLFWIPEESLAKLLKSLLKPLLFALSLSVFLVSTGASQTVDDELDERRGGWMVVHQVEYGTIYLDTTQVVPIDQDRYQVRTLWRFSKPQRDHEGEVFQSSVAVRAIDCRQNVAAILSFADQNNARYVNRMSLPAQEASWDVIAASSVIDRVAAKTCGKSRNNTVRVADRATQ